MLLVGPNGAGLSLFTGVGGFTEHGPNGLTSPWTTAPRTRSPTTTQASRPRLDRHAAGRLRDPLAGVQLRQLPLAGADQLLQGRGHRDRPRSVRPSTGPTRTGHGTSTSLPTRRATAPGRSRDRGGWSLNITTAAALASTTTTLNSSPNPSFTSGANSSVTLTAAVSSSGSPVTAGTVDFTDGGTTISGCGAASLSSAPPPVPRRLLPRVTTTWPRSTAALPAS